MHIAQHSGCTSHSIVAAHLTSVVEDQPTENAERDPECFKYREHSSGVAWHKHIHSHCASLTAPHSHCCSRSLRLILQKSCFKLFSIQIISERSCHCASLSIGRSLLQMDVRPKLQKSHRSNRRAEYRHIADKQRINKLES